MDDFGFEKPIRRSVIELNLVPIIDMLTAVVFFLLLSTVFLGLTKLTLPPSGTTTAIIDIRKQDPPMNPKLIGHIKDKTLYLLISWSGKSPSSREFKVPLTGKNKEDTQAIIKGTSEIIQEFANKFPNEKNIQIGLSKSVPYQNLIAMMDGTTPIIRDVVLFSYLEAETLYEKLGR